MPCAERTGLWTGRIYSPARDMVIIPMKEQFNIGKNAEEIFKDGMEYYSSALHEMTHSTGTANRLNRDKGAKFGDAKYAKGGVGCGAHGCHGGQYLRLRQAHP
jgi:antirestriction protein ArdC